MPSLARFMGGAIHQSFGAGVTSYGLVASDIGGSRMVSVNPTTTPFFVELPWTDEQGGFGWSAVNQQKDTGDDIFLIHHAGRIRRCLRPTP